MKPRPGIGPIGVAHLRTLIQYADKGNTHAADWIRDIARRETAHGCPLPLELSEWLARPPIKRGRGKPTKAAQAATVGDALALERAKDIAAQAAWWNVRAEMQTSCPDGDAGPAFTEVAAWLSDAHGVHVGGSAVRTWYYDRKDAMDRHHAEVEAIVAKLN